MFRGAGAGGIVVGVVAGVVAGVVVAGGGVLGGAGTGGGAVVVVVVVESGGGDATAGVATNQALAITIRHASRRRGRREVGEERAELMIVGRAGSDTPVSARTTVESSDFSLDGSGPR